MSRAPPSKGGASAPPTRCVTRSPRPRRSVRCWAARTNDSVRSITVTRQTYRTARVRAGPPRPPPTSSTRVPGGAVSSPARRARRIVASRPPPWKWSAGARSSTVSASSRLPAAASASRRVRPRSSRRQYSLMDVSLAMPPVYSGRRGRPMVRRRTFARGIAVALTLGLAAGGAWGGDRPLWQVKTGGVRSEVQLYEQGGKLYGKIVGLPEPTDDQGKPKVCTKCQGADKDQPIVGLVIIKDLGLDGGRYKGGTILDPEDGKVYKAEVWQEGTNLKVRGYLGPFYKTQTWTKAK